MNLIFYSNNTSLLTLYKQHLKGIEAVSHKYASNWPVFVKMITECHVNKIIIIDVDSGYLSEEIGYMYFDPSSYFIFISNDDNTVALKKASLGESNILPLKFVVIEKSEALNSIKKDIEQILKYFAIEKKLLKKGDLLKNKYLLAEMFKFYSDRINEGTANEQIQNILERIYIQLDSFVDKDKIILLTESKDKYFDKSFEEVYFLEDTELVCPACKLKFSAQTLCESKLKKIKEHDDFYIEYEGIEVLLHEIIICDGCYYAALKKDFNIIFRNIVKDKLNKNRSVRKKIADSYNEEKDPVAKGMIALELACKSYYLFRPDYFTATIELRKYWLEKYLGKKKLDVIRKRIIQLLESGIRSTWSPNNPHVGDINIDFLHFYLISEDAVEWSDAIENLYNCIMKNRSKEYALAREKAELIRESFKESATKTRKKEPVKRKKVDDSMMEIL